MKNFFKKIQDINIVSLLIWTCVILVLTALIVLFGPFLTGKTMLPNIEVSKNLIWDHNDYGPMSFSEGKGYCELNKGESWRLPSTYELLEYGPTINLKGGERYWSSTPFVVNTSFDDRDYYSDHSPYSKVSSKKYYYVYYQKKDQVDMTKQVILCNTTGIGSCNQIPVDDQKSIGELEEKLNKSSERTRYKGDSPYYTNFDEFVYIRCVKSP